MRRSFGALRVLKHRYAVALETLRAAESGSRGQSIDFCGREDEKQNAIVQEAWESLDASESDRHDGLRTGGRVWFLSGKNRVRAVVWDDHAEQRPSWSTPPVDRFGS